MLNCASAPNGGENEDEIWKKMMIKTLSSRFPTNQVFPILTVILRHFLFSHDLFCYMCFSILPILFMVVDVFACVLNFQISLCSIDFLYILLTP